MKAEKVLFKNLAKGTLFIHAKNIPNHHVFQKIGPTTAKVYGSEKTVTFESTHDVIVVTETSFGVLPITQFALSSAARAACGIIVPLEVLVKCPTPFSGHGSATHVDISQSCQPIYIDSKERVINLGHIFNFKNITVATLNT